MRLLGLVSLTCWLASLLPVSGAAVAVQSLDDIQYWVGTGTNRAALIIDWQDGKNAPGESLGQAIVWGYRWPAGQSRTGQQMIEDIAAADPRLYLKVDTRSFGQIVFGIAYDLDADGGTYTFDPATESGGASDAGDHFAEGWELGDGYWGYKLGAPSTSRPAFTMSGSGFSSRSLSNGSWDAWVFTSFELSTIPNPDPALAATVPEPSSLLLLASGAVLYCWRRRR